MALKFMDKIRDSLKEDEQRQGPNRFAGVESFFGRRLGDGPVSWGLLLLGAFGVYAVANLVSVILKFF